ncbi:hypothetical protein EDD21DRAFT_377420 [Dissophora ornata]|nr:hypothetical protein EDD21DRAFT_377420 [Dissophora ornata]
MHYLGSAGVCIIMIVACLCMLLLHGCRPISQSQLVCVLSPKRIAIIQKAQRGRWQGASGREVCRLERWRWRQRPALASVNKLLPEECSLCVAGSE